MLDKIMNVMTKRPGMLLGVTKGFSYKGFFDEKQAREAAKLTSSGSPSLIGGNMIEQHDILKAIKRYSLDHKRLRAGNPLNSSHIRSISDHT